MALRFGDCVLDTATRQLRVGGGAVHISPKAFQFLELLIRQRPRALSKDEIHEQLWAGTFVSDGTLTSLLAEVRAAIDDDAHEPRFVRTVHRFGYAFSGAVEEEKEPSPQAGSPQFAYRLFWGKREIVLEEGDCVLGRDPSATVFVDHKSVSRRHARIRISAGRVTVEDLGSKNGTCVAGEKIHRPVPLSDGDEIRVGSVGMTYRAFLLQGSTETAHPPTEP